MFYTDTWVYFHVPKTSGTNIFLNAEKYGNVTKGYRYNPERHNPIWYWESKSAGNNSYKLYTTVRNPYARIVSLWNHLNYFEKATFENFILNKLPLIHFLKGHSLMGDCRWDTTTTMFEHLSDKSGKLPDDLKVFKVESDLHDLEKELGFQFTHTRHKSLLGKNDYKSHYTDELQEVVYNRYKKDFLEFGYYKEL